MKPKTIKIMYWTATILFAAFMTFSGISELQQNESAQTALTSLGYPIYLNYILGVAKLLGVLALLWPKWKTVTEWAYAGFAIDIIGAAASMFFVGAGAMGLFPLAFLVVMFISYGFWKKNEALKGQATAVTL